MSNHKKPSNVHKLHGTFRPDRHGDDPDIEIGAPIKPEWLSAAASAEWDRSVPIMEGAGYLSVNDQMPLALYCELVADFQADPKGFPAARLTQLRLLMGELGMTPASRAKITVKKTDKPSNPFGDL